MSPSLHAPGGFSSGRAQPAGTDQLSGTAIPHCPFVQHGPVLSTTPTVDTSRAHWLSAPRQRAVLFLAASLPLALLLPTRSFLNSFTPLIFPCQPSTVCRQDSEHQQHGENQAIILHGPQPPPAQLRVAATKTHPSQKGTTPTHPPFPDWH